MAFLKSLRLDGLLSFPPGSEAVALTPLDLLIGANATPTAFARDAAACVAHLAQRDGWDLSATRPERAHLMVRCMKAWIVADPAALGAYYGQGFAPNVLPARPNLEEEPKPDVNDKLTRATRGTKKGDYGKIKHASQLLQRIDPAKVAQRCPRLGTLTRWLEQTIDGA